jgi:molecular chaperone DnaK
VKAKDKGTGKEQHITITGSSNIPEEEIERMKKEAEQFAEEDKKKKESIEARNKAESLVLQSERTLKESGDKVGDDIKQPVTEKIEALKKLLEDATATPEQITKGYDELSEAIQKVGAAMYQQPTQTPPAEGATETDEDVKVYEKDKKPEDNSGPVEGEVVN